MPLVGITRGEMLTLRFCRFVMALGTDASGGDILVKMELEGVPFLRC